MIGKNIKHYRENKKLTQEDMADKLNVTRQAISSWETGKTQPDIETLHNIAQALDVSVEEVIYGERRVHTTVFNNKTVRNITEGLSFGSALAMIISYVAWESIGWAILHGMFSWAYVIYYIIKYGWS